MTCSTCDDYQLVPTGPGGMLEDCPDCHACAPRAWCPVHSVRLDEQGRCRRCVSEARSAAAALERRAAAHAREQREAVST